MLVFDEAQHLSNCVSGDNSGTTRSTTALRAAVRRHPRARLWSWRSRFHAGQALPGISEEEAATIVHSELGVGLSRRKIQKLISKSRITDLRNGGQHSYVSARRLFWVIRELQGVANRGPKGRADSFRAADDKPATGTVLGS